MEISQAEYEQRSNSVMALRLETERQLLSMRLFLMGKKEKIKKVVSGDSILEEVELVKVSEPMLNEEGIHAVMSWMESHIDPSLVQGNHEKWDDFIIRMMYYRQDFADSLTENCVNWGLKDTNYTLLVDMTYDRVFVFLSRTVKNLERESYTHTLRTSENTKLQTEDRTKTGFSLFGRGGMQT